MRLRKRSLTNIKKGFYWSVFVIGLAIMALGIAMMIEADLGSAPWDVLHIGLYNHFGLTVGTWSIIVGIVIIGTACILERQLPLLGALINMVLVGVFIDLFLYLLSTPDLLIGRWVMLIVGILINGTGISLYIAADRGAGPRDTLMLFLTKKTGWRLASIRRLMEVFVLLFGWLLGGPVSFGTLLFGLTIGSIIGKLLPVFQANVKKVIERGADLENINEGPVRSDHHDGVGKELRQGTNVVKVHR